MTVPALLSGGSGRPEAWPASCETGYAPMPVICFETEAGSLLGQVDGLPGDTLIDLARLHEIPLHWRCGQGTCGTCRLHLKHSRQPCLIHLSRKERSVLLREACLSPEEAACDVLTDQPGLWRLACHCVVNEDDLTVIVPAPDA